MINNNFKKTMPIFDLGDFILREERQEDVESFFSYYTLPEVNQYILCRVTVDIEDAKHDFYYWKNSYQRGDGAYFAIARKNDDIMIGSIGLTGLNRFHHRIEISYDLSPNYWGKGLMSKAINKICDYGFYEFKVNRIEANVMPENLKSINLLLKNNFKIEGYLRQHRYHNNSFHDIVLYSILREDYYKK